MASIVIATSLFAAFASYKNFTSGNVYNMGAYRLPSIYNMLSLMFFMGFGNTLSNKKTKLIANIRKCISKSNGSVQRYLQDFGDEVIIGNLEIKCGKTFLINYQGGFKVKNIYKIYL